MGRERAFVLCVVPLLLLRGTVCDRLPLLHARARPTEEKPPSAGCLKDLLWLRSQGAQGTVLATVEGIHIRTVLWLFARDWLLGRECMGTGISDSQEGGKGLKKEASVRVQGAGDSWGPNPA